MIIEKMERLCDENNTGVVFTGSVFPEHVKRSLYSFDDMNTSSIHVNQFIIDMTSEEKCEEYSFYCADKDILTKVKKLMKLPTAFEPLDCCFSEMLHTRGKFLWICLSLLFVLKIKKKNS